VRDAYIIPHFVLFAISNWRVLVWVIVLGLDASVLDSSSVEYGEGEGNELGKDTGGGGSKISALRGPNDELDTLKDGMELSAEAKSKLRAKRGILA
ncbi:hypothetical protein A4X09_0g7580, partial [Tilletia walkeri]